MIQNIDIFSMSPFTAPFSSSIEQKFIGFRCAEPRGSDIRVWFCVVHQYNCLQSFHWKYIFVSVWCKINIKTVG